MRGPVRAGAREACENQCLESKETSMRRINLSLLDDPIRAAGAFVVLATLLLVAFSLSVSGPPAWSQTARSIKMVVPIGPGSGLDIVARLLAEQS